jgi:smad nuclear-interacting protein 1
LANKLQPDFKPSGALEKAARTTEKGVELKYAEPAEARKPPTRWRLYPFKGEEALEPYMIYRKSCYIFGRDRQVVDVPTDHPSCSKQHAAIQFREVEIEDKSTGMMKRVVKPYIIDLGSTNGTFLNSVKIDSERYIELLPKDSIKFGFSSREYIVIHEKVSVNAPEGV